MVKQNNINKTHISEILSKIRLLHRKIKQNPIYEIILWRHRGYDAPSPWYVKHAVLVRNSFKNSTWVETGTFLGETTDMLSRHAKKVFSIEPAIVLYNRAVKKFSHYNHVEILNGTSEVIFPDLLKKIDGPVNFWLDGHYSAGATFLGDKDTPIKDELFEIEKNIMRYSSICVFIDDVRCFGSDLSFYTSYPSLDFLVDWARRNKLKWHIEHDIFVAKSLA